MLLRNNPVLGRELLQHLRQGRSFLLLAVYVAALAGVVLAAWPEAQKLDLTNPEAARRLVNLFFLGQYVMAALMVPAFAAGAITGEKERHSYEMLLASPLRPAAIVAGKLLAALVPVMLLVFSSLPIVVLCLPLGGVSFVEVVALYGVLLTSMVAIGAISLTASSYFPRTSAALVVSYLVLLPLLIGGVLFWISLEGGGESVRLWAIAVLVPATALMVLVLLRRVGNRLVYPPDLGSEGKQVIDTDQELREAVGMVIRRDQWPDSLFAPPKRTDLLPDRANPVFDKEMRSELFSQGTLMLRLVIQISMALAWPLMAVCLYLFPAQAAWYACYVVLFNLLVGPVFSAGSVTSERERQTLDLLLGTILSPRTILVGKLLSGLRVSSVLTLFLAFAMPLACLLTVEYWRNLHVFAGYLGIILLVCLTTSVLALFCSVTAHKTTTSLVAAYLVLGTLFLLPPAVAWFAATFYPASSAMVWSQRTTFVSPFSVAFSLPLVVDAAAGPPAHGWNLAWAFVGFYGALNLLLLGAMIWLFHRRWRVSE